MLTRDLNPPVPMNRPDTVDHDALRTALGPDVVMAIERWGACERRRAAAEALGMSHQSTAWLTLSAEVANTQGLVGDRAIERWASVALSDAERTTFSPDAAHALVAFQRIEARLAEARALGYGPATVLEYPSSEMVLAFDEWRYRPDATADDVAPPHLDYCAAWFERPSVHAQVIRAVLAQWDDVLAGHLAIDVSTDRGVA